MSSSPSALRSTLIVSFTRAVAAGLTVVQGVCSARFFGTSVEKDCFLVAQTIPSMCATLLVGGLYSTLLVNLAEIGRSEGARGQRAFAGRIIRLFTMALILPVGLILLSPASLVHGVAPGFSEQKIALTSSLLRFTIFTSLGVMYMSTLRCMFQVRAQFAVPNLVGLLDPFVSLLVLLLFVRSIGIYTLATGPLLGGWTALAALFSLVPRVLKDPPGTVHDGAHADETARRVRRFWIAFLPMSIGANFGQINLAVDNAFASFLPTGSITMLGFAFVIVSNSQLLTSSTFAEVAFQRFAAAGAASAQELKALFRSQLRYMLLLTTPLSVGACAFATPLIRLLFERGAFSSESTAGVAGVLRAYAPGIFFFGFLTLLSLLLMARRRFGLLASVATSIIGLNALLDYGLVRAFGVRGIALGTSLTVLVHALILARPVSRSLGGIVGPGDFSYVLKVATSALAMGATVFLYSAGFERWLDPALEGVRFLEVGAGLVLGVAVDVILLHMFRVEEARALVRRILGPILRAFGVAGLNGSKA